MHRVNVASNYKIHVYGLVIYCRKGKNFNIQYNFNDEEKLQACSLVTGLYDDIAICSGYKPLSTKYSLIKPKIEEMIEMAEEKSKKIIFLRDFNIDLNNEPLHSFFEMLRLKNLQSLLKNNECTTNSTSAIDIFFSNFQFNCGMTETFFGYLKQLTCILNESKSNHTKSNKNPIVNYLTLLEAINEGKWPRSKLIHAKVLEKNDFSLINK